MILHLKVEDEVERKQYSLGDYSVLFSDMDCHYKTLVDTLPGIVYALDEKGHFAYISETVQDVLGYSQDDLIGLHFSKIVHPEDLPAVSRDYILPKFNGIPTGNERAPKLFDERRSPPRRTADLRMRLLAKTNKNGQTKPISCYVNSSGQHRIDDSHRFLGTVGMLFDFHSEDEISISPEKRNAYNPFELLSQAMRHTFSNVFTGIYGNLQVMEMQIRKNKDISHSIEAIKVSIENAVEVIKQLSNITCESSFWKTPLSTEYLIKEIVDDLFKEKQVSFEYTVQSDLYSMEIDQDYARHIIRSVFFLIRENVGEIGNVKIDLSNVVTLPPDIPRLDCKYISMNVTITDKEKEVPSKIVAQLDRVAATSLGYIFLKKNGGLIKIISENVVALYLPAV